MTQIKYNSASNVLRFEFPVEWNGADISGLTVAAHDKDGVELLAAQSATLYTATELDGDVAAFLNEITLDSGAGNLSPGDPILIDGAAGPEPHFVQGYDSTGKIVTLEDTLENAHEDADAVYGLWGTYTLDTTTVATWTVGLEVVLTWTPAGTGQPTTEVVQIAKSVVDVKGLAKRFSLLFPRAFEYYTDGGGRLQGALQEAEHEVIFELEGANLDVNRIVDQDVISSAIMYKMAYLWTIQADDNLSDERAALSAEYDKKISLVKSLPIWVDQDQDGIEDDAEVDQHRITFRRSL